MKFYLIVLKSSTLAWISLPSEARNNTVTWTNKCPSKNKQTKSREQWRISLILKPCDLKFDMHAVKTLFYFMKPADYTHTVWFFRRLKRVGSVLSRSALDPFLYIWYHTVRNQNGLSPCGLDKDLDDTHSDG